MPSKLIVDPFLMCLRIRVLWSSQQHIDGHQHCHLIPGIASVVSFLARSFGVRYVRLPYVDEERIESFEPAHLRQFYRQISSQALEASVIFRDEGLFVSGAFAGFALMCPGALSLTTMEAMLRRACRRRGGFIAGAREGGGWQERGASGVCEVMCHVGYRGVDGDEFNQSADRQEELELWTGRQLPALLEQLSLQLITVADLVSAEEALMKAAQQGSSKAMDGRLLSGPTALSHGHLEQDDERLLRRYRGNESEEDAILNQAAWSDEWGCISEVNTGVSTLSTVDDHGQKPQGHLEAPSREGRLLILSSTTSATGNFITAGRLAAAASCLGWASSCVDPAVFNDSAQLSEYVHKEGFSCIIGIHAYRSGKLLIGSLIP